MWLHWLHVRNRKKQISLCLFIPLHLITAVVVGNGPVVRYLHQVLSHYFPAFPRGLWPTTNERTTWRKRTGTNRFLPFFHLFPNIVWLSSFHPSDFIVFLFHSIPISLAITGFILDFFPCQIIFFLRTFALFTDQLVPSACI